MKYTLNFMVLFLFSLASIFAGGAQESGDENVVLEREAESIGPSAASFYHRSLNLWDDPELAVSLLEQALELEPHNPIYKFQLAFVLKELGQYQDAVLYLEQTIDIDPGFGQAYDLLVDILFHIEEYELAEELLYLGIQRAVPEPSLYIKANWGLLEKGDFEGALELIDFASEFALPKEQIALLIQKAHIFVDMRDYDGAVSLYEEARRIMPENSEIYFKLSELHNRRDEVDRAEEILLSGIDISWDSHWLRTELANLYLSEGRAQEANALLEVLSIEDKEDYYVQELLAKSYVALESFDSALPLLNELIPLDDENPELYYLRAQINWLTGDDSQALSDVRESLIRDEAFSRAYALKGQILLGQSLSELAAEEFVRAAESYQRDYFTTVLGYIGYSILGDEVSDRVDFPERSIKQPEIEQLRNFFRKYPDYAEIASSQIAELDFSLF